MSDWVWVNRQRASGKDISFYPYSKAIGALYVQNNENIKIMMKDLGIFGQWIYDIEYWTQMYYEGSTSHVSHSHFGTGAQVSWVHVIDAPEDQDCFHFIDSKCNKIYPKNQRSDTLFAFPSWAVHGVDSLKVNYDRIIVAGNVIFKTQL